MAIYLPKAESMELLKKRSEMVNKICQKKYNMSLLTSRVALVLDVSSSMKAAFDSGVVQGIIERLLPIALNLTENRELEFWTFNHGFQYHSPINIYNYYSYLVLERIIAQGQTNYSPVIQDTMEYLGMKQTKTLPAIVIFITDGNCNDRFECDEVLRRASKYPVFYQFIGLGDKRRFSYLRNLDNIKFRYVDNMDFFAVDSLVDQSEITDKDLYSELLDKYTRWMDNKKVKRMLHRTSRDDVFFSKRKQICDIIFDILEEVFS